VGGDFPKARALDAGLKGRHRIAAFQFRVKGMDDHAAARLAAPLQAICAEREVAFIVNDSISLAKRLNADGVHLGQEDGARRKAARLGPDAQIGVTCHDSRHLAMDAGEAGADYVAFRRLYPTTTKETNTRRAGPAGLVADGLRSPAWPSAGSSRQLRRLWCAPGRFPRVSSAIWEGMRWPMCRP
jgi:thiamine-phosphate pyrophosphorylase